MREGPSAERRPTRLGGSARSPRQGSGSPAACWPERIAYLSRSAMPGPSSTEVLRSRLCPQVYQEPLIFLRRNLSPRISKADHRLGVGRPRAGSTPERPTHEQDDPEY